MRKIFKWGSVLLILVIIIACVATFIRVNNFSETISGKGLLTSELSDRANKSDRFNLLVMGYGGKGHPGAFLTDSMLIYSIPMNGGEATEVSVPRDLWIESPSGSGNHMKINAAFATAYAQSNDLDKAANSTSRTVSNALGVPIDGWMLVDFTGFRDLVDALGGVTVDVQRSFTAKYPKSDNPSVSNKWIKVSFKKGEQHMNGEEAMRYSRARYSDDPLEGSDFARSARQQRLVSAIKSKMLGPGGWIHGPAVMNSVEDDIHTNVSAGDLIRIFSHRVDNKHRTVLSDGNVLVSSHADGQYILLPRNNSWQNLHQFVQAAVLGKSSSEG